MRVLLAEDDTKLGKLTKYMLEQNKISAEWIQRGDEIYDFAMYNDEYDVLILDWMLPGESGVEACRKLRKAGYQKAVLLLTASMVISLLSGCGIGAIGKEDVTIIVKCPPYNILQDINTDVTDAHTFLEQAGNAFSEQYEDANVTVEVQLFDYTEEALAITDCFDTENAVDVLFEGYFMNNY